MLITLIGTLLGAVSNILPGILALFQQKANQAHEIDMAKLEMSKMELASKLQIDVANVNADIGEGKSLYANDEHFSGGVFWEAFRASVRPVLTYAFFFIFVFVKVSAVVVLMRAGLQVTDALPIIWDENTQAIFGAIMGFYFGSRTLERFGFANTAIRQQNPVLQQTVITKK
jgi:hypothetical protein